MKQVKSRKRRKLFFGRATFVCFLSMIIIAGFVFVCETQKLELQRQKLTEKSEELVMQIAAEDNRTKNLEERKRYVKTKLYIEDIARSQLGLIGENEVVLRENAE